MGKGNRRRTETAVATPRSMYRKIQIVLAEARRDQCHSFEDLVEQIDRRGHLDFSRYQIGQDHSVDLVPCSKESIRRIVDLCDTLGLIDKTIGKLTQSGMRAADSRHFDETMRKSLVDTLERFGTSLQEVKKVISDLLTSCNAKVLPTWDVIYDRIGSPGGKGGKDKFRTYLSLLSACKGITYSRRKIYLP